MTVRSTNGHGSKHGKTQRIWFQPLQPSTSPTTSPHHAQPSFRISASLLHLFTHDVIHQLHRNAQLLLYDLRRLRRLSCSAASEGRGGEIRGVLKQKKTLDSQNLNKFQTRMPILVRLFRYHQSSSQTQEKGIWLWVKTPSEI